MRSIFILMFFVFCTNLVLAQQNFIDVIHLMDGNIVKGQIVEHFGEEEIKIKIADGSVFTYKISEIEKVTKESKSKSQEGLFFGASYAAILTKSQKNGDLNANYDFGSTSLKLGYIFKKNVGFVVGGDVHFKNSSTGGTDRVTYIAKAGPVISMVGIHLYPMLGYVGGEPAYDLGIGTGYYVGIGFDFRFASSAGIYIEYGICDWGREFEKDTFYGKESYELDDDLISHSIAIGVSLQF